MPPQAMDSHDNHYEYLGIPIAASRHEVHAAVEELIRQANALAYTSPDRARQLWARIRRIRADLLTHPKRREAYDAELLRSLETPALALAALPRLVDAAAASAAGTAPPQDRAAAPTAAAEPAATATPAAEGPPWLVSALLSGALVAMLVAAMLISTLSQRTQPRTTALKAPHVAPVAMSVRGSTHGGAYLPERPIQLRWSPNAHATRYRIQLASADGTLSAGTAFRHPLMSLVTGGMAYRLHLPGGRLYAWRLQALVHGRWQTYGSARVFYVARPVISHPLAGGTTRRHTGTHRSTGSSRAPEMAAVVKVRRGSRHRTPIRTAARRSPTSRTTSAPATAAQPAVAYVPSKTTSRPAGHTGITSARAPGRPSSAGRPVRKPASGKPISSKPVSGKPGSGKPVSRKPPAQAPPPPPPPPTLSPQPAPPVSPVPVVPVVAPPAVTKGSIVNQVQRQPTQSVPVTVPTTVPVTTGHGSGSGGVPGTVSPPPVTTPGGNTGGSTGGSTGATGGGSAGSTGGPPGQSNHPGHPQHPEHPAHPSHPKHP